METLKEHRARALVQHLDMSNVPLQAVVKGRATFTSQLNTLGLKQTPAPEHEALWFYLRNHAMAVLARVYDPAEPLGEHAELVDGYHRHLQASSLRMYYYLLQICTRESRHAHNYEALLKSYPELATWYMTYRGTSSDKAVNALVSNAPNVSVGYLTRFLVDVFYKCGYSGGYGGKKWGAIADVLKQFVHGEITGEMMMDTAFTLCHNNGPIFNKGMWFSMYDSAAIKEILDVQRAGMIPAYINDCAVGGPLAQHYAGRNFVTQAMRGYVGQLASLSTEFSGSVSWARVKELGALGSYSHLIQMQGKSAPTLSVVEQMKAKKAAAEVAAAKAAQWQIMPGVYAQKYKPARFKVATSAAVHAVEEI